MVVKNQAVQAASKRPAAKPAAKTKTLTMRHLWRMTLWGATAASALLLAVLTSRSEVGSQRVADAISSLHGKSALRQVAARSFDAQTETRRLSVAVRGLTEENKTLQSRLAAVEHNVDDMTGSITRQLAAVKAETESHPSANPAPAPAAPDVTGAVAATPPSAAPPPDEPAAAAGAPAEYGVDIGSALSIQVLRARWLGIRSAHAKLFEGLTPTAVLREVPQSKHVELRLVVGPLASSEAAAQLCASLVPFRLYCQPTAFDKNRVALQ